MPRETAEQKEARRQARIRATRRRLATSGTEFVGGLAPVSTAVGRSTRSGRYRRGTLIPSPSVLGASVPRRTISISSSSDPSHASEIRALLPDIELNPLEFPEEQVGFSRSVESSVHSGRVPPGQRLISGFLGAHRMPRSLSRESQDVPGHPDYMEEESMQESVNPFVALMQSASASPMSSGASLPSHLQGPVVRKSYASLSRENTPGRSPMSLSPAPLQTSALFNWPQQSYRNLPSSPGRHPLGVPPSPRHPDGGPLIRRPPGPPPLERASSTPPSSAFFNPDERSSPNIPGPPSYPSSQSSYARPFQEMISSVSDLDPNLLPAVPPMPLRIRRAGGSRAYVPVQKKRQVSFSQMKGMDVQKPSNFSIQQIGADHYIIRAREMNDSIKQQVIGLLDRVKGDTVVINGIKMNKQKAVQYIVQELSSKQVVQVAISGIRG